MSSTVNQSNLEPMWPTLVALVAAGALYAALPSELALDGSRWQILALVAGVLLPAEFFHAFGKHLGCRICGYLAISIVTASMIHSVIRLVEAIPKHCVPAENLLSSAIILWITNVLVFAAWYWRLDAGGPHKRNAQDEHKDGAFLFPQMTIPAEPTSTEGKLCRECSASKVTISQAAVPVERKESWSPRFIDYLFLAFNTSTALSPTDVPVLSRWAKVLMMIQALISMSVVVLLAARAVNIL